MDLALSHESCIVSATPSTRHWWRVRAAKIFECCQSRPVMPLNGWTGLPFSTRNCSTKQCCWRAIQLLCTSGTSTVITYRCESDQRLHMACMLPNIVLKCIRRVASIFEPKTNTWNLILKLLIVFFVIYFEVGTKKNVFYLKINVFLNFVRFRERYGSIRRLQQIVWSFNISQLSINAIIVLRVYHQLHRNVFAKSL